MDQIEQIEETIREKQKAIKYDLRSYSVSHLVEQFQFGELYIPQYQRGLVWKKSIQSRFIESLILGLPVSSITIAYTDDYRAEVIDGVQRVKTLESFVNDDLKLEGLEDLEVLNGLFFSSFPRSQQRKFLSRSISVIALSEEMSHEFRLSLFERINFGSSLKSSHELRQVLLDGPFIDLVRELASRDIFESTINVTSFMRRRKDSEDIIIKFFCLSNDLPLYRGNMNKFLDSCVKKYNYNFQRNIFESEFERTIIFVNKYFKDLFYDKKIKFSRGLFDSIFVGVNLALRENPNLSPNDLGWINSDEFLSKIKNHAIQSPKVIKERVNFVKDTLLGRN